MKRRTINFMAALTTASVLSISGGASRVLVAAANEVTAVTESEAFEDADSALSGENTMSNEAGGNDSAVQDELEAAKAEVERAQENVNNAQAVLLQKQAAAEEKNSELALALESKTQADAQVDEKTLQLQEAQAALDAANEKAAEGSYGFFGTLENGAELIKLLDEAKYASYTVKGSDEDATSLENMKASIQWMRKCNELREQNGLSAQKVSMKLMAMAQSNANYSNHILTHSQQFYCAENLAWGNSDPFVAWYDKEKASYESGVTAFKSVGHYLNIISTYNITGYAVCTGKGTKYGTTHSQTFGYLGYQDSSGMTVDEFESLFMAYYNSVMVEPGEQYQAAASMLAEAQSVQNSQTEIFYAAQTAAEEMMAEQATAEENLQQCQAALEAAQKVYHNLLAEKEAQEDKDDDTETPDTITTSSADKAASALTTSNVILTLPTSEAMDETVQKTLFEEAAEHDRTLEFDFYEGEDLAYSWTFDGSAITNPSQTVSLQIIIDANNPDVTSLVDEGVKQIDYRFLHDGALPGPVEIKVDTKNMVSAGDLYLYYYNPETKALELVADHVPMEGRYATFTLTHCSDYVLSNALISTKPNEPSSPDSNGTGNDTNHAGTGNDANHAGTGNDANHAGTGNDTNNAGTGNDANYAGTGNDANHAGTGNDANSAGTGNDTITEAEKETTAENVKDKNENTGEGKTAAPENSSSAATGDKNNVCGMMGVMISAMLLASVRLMKWFEKKN